MGLGPVARAHPRRQLQRHVHRIVRSAVAGRGIPRARLFLEEPVQADCFVRRVELGRGMGISVDLPENCLRARYLGFVRDLSRQSP